MPTSGPLKDFVELRSAWAETPAGRGGLAALAGFDFQLALALVELIKHHEADSPARVFVEALSDVVAHDDGKIVITQAKRTLSSGALSKALDELWAINCLARKINSYSEDHFIYRVVAARQSLRDWEEARDRWRPSEKPEEAEKATLVAFKSRVTCACAVDPRLEAARLLVLHFRDPTPLDTVDKFIGWLIAAAKNSAFDDATSQITIALSGLVRASQNREHAFRLWGLADRAPVSISREEDERQAVRIGERLTISDLREGRLANRRVYASLHSVCEDWLFGADGASGKLPVFWIDGRSGSGKSAALLHLLAKLHEEDPSRVILWLGNRSESIGEAVAWIAPFLREGRRVIVGADDPNASVRQAFEAAARRARDEWDIIRNVEVEADRKAPLPPMVVCCGPTEQRQDAEATCGGDIEITLFELPRETGDDIDELAAWYFSRTGRKAPAMEGDILLVQRFFEWKNGKVTDFASRFRKRLERFDEHRSEKLVFNTMARILALGRLYTDYPADALERVRESDAVLEKAFVQLAEEETHFWFGGGSDGNSETGIRLTHPHLADAIYRAWFGLASDRGYRKSHLRDGLRAAIERVNLPVAQRFEPLWSIARIVTGRVRPGERGRHDLLERVNLVRNELTELLPELYAGISAHTAAPLADLPVWTDLDAAFDLGLCPAPLSSLSVVAASSELPAPGLRLACHKLLQYRSLVPDERHSIRVVAGVLNRLADWRDGNGRIWRDWIPLSIDFIRQIDVAPIAASVARISEANPTLPSITKLMFEIALVVRQQPEARPILISWLNRAPTWLPGWVAILGYIHERAGRCQDFDRLALRFLDERPTHASWTFFWEYLWKDGAVKRSELEARGLLWLSKVDLSLGRWTFVWDKLWGAMEGDPIRRVALETRLKAWLDEFDLGHDGGAFLSDKIWEAAEGDPMRKAGLCARACAWLGKIDPNQGSWALVWNKLWIAAESDPAQRVHLEAQADAWLLKVYLNNEYWRFVWATLWKASADDPDRRVMLATMAETWLDHVASTPNRWQWRDVWEYLWKYSHNDAGKLAALAARAEEWLGTVGADQDGWRTLWTKLWRAAQDNPMRRHSLANLAHKWLTSVDLDRHSWTFIWRAVWDAANDNAMRRDELFTLIHTWTGSMTPNPNHWQIIWEELWEVYRECPDHRPILVSRAEGWLQDVDTNSTNHSKWTVWIRIWQQLTKTFENTPTRRIELFTLANSWLAAMEPNNPEWSYVWRGIWEVSDRDADLHSVLFEHAFAWLGARNTNHSGWFYVWEQVSVTIEGDPVRTVVLSTLAERWLSDIDWKNWSWPIVWRWLWELPKNEGRSSLLAELGKKWLRSEARKKKRWELIWSALWILPDQQHEEMREIARELIVSNPLLDFRAIEDLLIAEKYRNNVTPIE